MKRIMLLVVVILAMVVVLGLLGTRMLTAQDGLKSGKIIQRTELKSAPGWEAILVQRTVPGGAENGKHTQGGNEIVYIQEGSVIFEAHDKPAVTLKAGEAFTTTAERDNAQPPTGPQLFRQRITRQLLPAIPPRAAQP